MNNIEAPHLWIPKVKIIEPPPIIGSRTRVEGFFLIEACNRYGQPKRSLMWKQLITNFGMGAIWSETFPSGPAIGHAFLGVGTGTSAFTNTSTALTSQVGSRNGATTSGSESRQVDTTGANNYRRRYSITKEFALGAINATLTEVGMFSGATGANGCFLDLIRDSGGSPTSFPVTSSDQLRVTHILDYYPQLTANTGSFTIGGGAGSGSHDYEASFSDIANASVGATNQQLAAFLSPASATYAIQAKHSVTSLGAVTAALGGTAISAGQVSPTGPAVSTSDNITWTGTSTLTYGLTQANHASGISGLEYAFNAGHKIWIDPPIPKFASSIQRILSLNLSSTYSRT